MESVECKGKNTRRPTAVHKTGGGNTRDILTTTKKTCINNNCAQNNTLGAKGYGLTTELHGTARKRGDNNVDNGRDNEDNYKKEIFDNKKNNMTQQRSRPKQHIGRKGVWVTTELHGIARKQGNNNEDNARCPNAIREKWKQRKNQ